MKNSRKELKAKKQQKIVNDASQVLLL